MAESGFIPRGPPMVGVALGGHAGYSLSEVLAHLQMAQSLTMWLAES